MSHSLEVPYPLRRAAIGFTWSIIAPGRSKRPQPLSDRPGNLLSPSCPFCEGNEVETEPEVFAVRGTGTQADGPGWKVRVVPNKYPALRPHTPEEPSACNLYDEQSAVGFHEVVIDTPAHDRRLVTFSLAQLETALTVCRSRLQILSADSNVRSIALFRNDGRAAGASVEHPHSQILALPIVPEYLQAELDSAQRYLRKRRRCWTCQLLERSRQEDGPVIATNSEFTALASLTARFPYETWIVPNAHAHDFRDCSDVQIRNLSKMLLRVLAALEATVGPYPFNLALQMAPIRASDLVSDAIHWRLELLPRLTIPSGLELGFGVFIVSVRPEDAARQLRAALRKD